MKPIYKWLEILIFLFCNVMLSLLACSFLFLRSNYWRILPALILLLVCNVLPWFSSLRFPSKRLHMCNHGVKCLCIFLISTTISIGFHIYLALRLLTEQWELFLLSALVCILAESAIFWNGIVSVYVTSLQLGIKLRLLGILFGFVPIVNLILLYRIIFIAYEECVLESKKFLVNQARRDQKLCATRYPVLLVHGVFFRDNPFINYWGRIPAELERNGCTIYYGDHQSAAAVADSAKEIEKRIKDLVAMSGCEKVNIIAHSKGGLDCRCAIAASDVGQYVASLTTVNTPHRGCLFADYLLERIPTHIQQKVARTYNKTMRGLGDHNPDFLAAVNDLTTGFCSDFDRRTPVPTDIYCQSIGSIQNRASGGKFPMNFTYLITKQYDGANDGLVGEGSFRFSDNYQLLTAPDRHGISHGDIIDLMRRDLKTFDVREFYVQLVSDLREKGY